MKLYTPLINKALKIAYDAHRSQTDKSGTPYIYHPAFLAAQMETEDEIVTALLHDIVEDTQVTFADLEREGFPQTVLDALKLLTHEDDGDYASYIDRIGTNPLAAKVKCADRRHNNDPTRSANLPPKEAARYRKKYDEALLRLEERVTEWAELLRNAQHGNTKAMFQIGVGYYWGRVAPLDKRKAFEWFSRAMEKGLPKDEEYISPDDSELACLWGRGVI